MKAIGIIPARLSSTRLPEKVLKEIAGKPLIQHVWEQAKNSKSLERVLVACDDERIFDCVEGFGGEAVMTRKDHLNGSSRIAEVAKSEDADILINIQGDQPLLDILAIDQMVDVLKANEDLQVVTFAKKIKDAEAYQNPNIVKVVCDESGNALYFSRAAIPVSRDSEEAPEFLKHIGVYGYKKDFLLKFVDWEETFLEKSEKLEQLRVLEKGYNIKVIETQADFLSVDTEEDLKKAEELILSH